MSYIEREALLAKFEAAEEDDIDLYGVHIAECFPAERAMQIANSIPAADVAPVVHGHWITGLDNWTVCSECKALGSPQWKGCPVCLARMDGE